MDSQNIFFYQMTVLWCLSYFATCLSSLLLIYTRLKTDSDSKTFSAPCLAAWEGHRIVCKYTMANQVQLLYKLTHVYPTASLSSELEVKTYIKFFSFPLILSKSEYLFWELLQTKTYETDTDLQALKHSYLILKEHASHFFSTTKMIILRTTIVKAAHCGPLDATGRTLYLQPPLVSTVHIHQGPIQSLVHFWGPQGTV